MTSLTFYGGVNEVGGNKILLGEGKTKVFLDFGKSFSTEGCYFDEPFLSAFYIPDLLNIGAIPKIDNLYKNTTRAPPIDAVLITHPHVDHYEYISLLNRNIKIYLGSGTKDIIEIRDKTYRGSWDIGLENLTFETFSSGEQKKLGELSFKPVHVDHSIPAAYGYIIYCKNKTIAYTGDFRFHGPMGWMTKEFVKALEKEKKVDALICEGTNITPKGEDEFLKTFEEEFRKRWRTKAPERISKMCKTEDDVRREMRGVAEEMDNLVVVETSPVDVDRIRTVWRVAKDTGRKILLDARQAYLTYNLAARGKIKDLPTLKDSLVYMSRKKLRDRMPTDPEDMETGRKWRNEYERDLFDMRGEICWGPEGREKLRKNGDEFLLCTSNAAMRFMELRYERAFKCNFILSRSEPFNEEMIISFDKLLHWLALFKIDKYYQIHVSGHANRKEMKETIERINPTTLYPIHTEHPKMFEGLVKGVKVERPEVGKGYKINP